MSEERLIPLPNGDLHRGMRDRSAVPNTEIEHMESMDPMNKAVAEVLKSAKGAQTLTCLWCGLQFEGQHSEKAIRDHLERDHPSVVKRADSSSVLMAALANATAQK